jgi:hypothetical protein
MPDELRERIYQIVCESDLISTKNIVEKLHEGGLVVKREDVNSVLYGELRERVIRDKDDDGIPLWRVRRVRFSAAGGLEAKLYKELVRQGIVAEGSAQLGFGVKNTRNNKRYHLDIAIRKDNNRYNIEVDGFDHVRADALSSIDRQLEKNGQNAEIEIDWMDHEKSYTNFSIIHTSRVYRWLGGHLDWCVRYHEELLWPKDISRNIWLIEKGWRVMRIWNAEIERDMNKTIASIRDFLG